MVLTFCMFSVAEVGLVRIQRWLAKALFSVTVTSPPGLVALLVMASPPFSEVMTN